MNLIAPVIPGLSVAFLTLLAVLPWGVSEETRFFLPLLPLIAIHYWCRRQPRLMPVAFAFASGLVMDALTNGPLGLWSLIYLVCFALAGTARESDFARSALARWAEFVFCIAIISAVEWALSSLYFARLIWWRPLGTAFVAAALVYPLFALVFWPLDRIWSRTGLGPLVRGD